MLLMTHPRKQHCSWGWRIHVFHHFRVQEGWRDSVSPGLRSYHALHSHQVYQPKDMHD